MPRPVFLLLAALLSIPPFAGARAEGDLAHALDAHLAAYAEATGFMGSALVARGDEVVLARGYGMADLEHGVPNDADTVFRLGSLTKQFTAALILRLQEQGLLSVEDTLATHLPDYPNGDRITLRQLLSHTAGIPDYTSLPSFPDTAREPHTTAELVALFRDLPLDFEPGTGFAYSNSGYVLLTAVVEVVTGRPYASYLEEALLVPLGLTGIAYDDAGELVPGRAAGYAPGADGYRAADYVDMSVPSGAGALRATVGDLLAWSRALLGGEVLQPASLAAMTTPVSPLDPTGTSGYGYGVIVSDEGGHRTVSHGGGIQGFAAQLASYPDDDLVVVVLSNVQTAPSGRIASDLAAIAFGRAVEAPRVVTPVAVDPAVLRAYVGGYEIGPDMVVDVTTEEGRLFIEIPGQGRYELLAETDERFVQREMGVVLRFVREGDAVVRFEALQGDEVAPALKVR